LAGKGCLPGSQTVIELCTPTTYCRWSFCESVAKLGVDAVSRVGQHNTTVQVCRYRRADLIQSDVRLDLKLNLFGHLRHFPPLGILGPFLR